VQQYPDHASTRSLRSHRQGGVFLVALTTAALAIAATPTPPKPFRIIDTVCDVV